MDDIPENPWYYDIVQERAQKCDPLFALAREQSQHTHNNGAKAPYGVLIADHGAGQNRATPPNTKNEGVVSMAAQLTDKQRKRIIADYIEIGSYNATAKVHGVSPNTVKKIVQANANIAEKCEQKREENTRDMLAFMESRRGKAQAVIDLCFEALTDPDRMAVATASQIATVMGIMIDKFAKVAEKPAAVDDGFVEALNGKAGEVWSENEHGDIPL